MTFTKEQLISAANARMEFAEMMMTKDLLPLQIRNWSIEAELARIALASMTAEPVAWQWEYRDKNHVTNDQARAKLVAQDGDVTVQPLFTAPPAPVSVQINFEEWSRKCDLQIQLCDPEFREKAQYIWNACRAAMLQGAGRPQNQPQNIPENIPAGWTGNGGADAALVMLDRIDTLDSDDDARIEDIKRIIRKLAGSPAEPARQHYKLPDDFDFDRFNDVVWLEAVASNPHMHSPTTSTIAMVALELNRKLAAGNSPAIPDDVRRMDWLVSKTVDVREPMVYGSHSLFWSQTITDEEDDHHATKLREQIDAAMAAENSAAPQQEAKNV